MVKQLFVPVSALVVAAASATAQDFGNGVGYIGGGLSYGEVVENRSPDSNVSYMPFYVEGQYSFPVYGMGFVGAEGYFGYADWDESQADFDQDNPEREMRVALHYSHIVTPDLRVGGFAAYSRSALVTDDLQREPYETIYGGIEAQYFLGDDFMVFGQAGLGDTFEFPPDQSTGDPEGFRDARFVRAGVTWFPLDSTAITFEYENASADSFLNGGDDSGSFHSIGLSGETVLPMDIPLEVTYFARRDFYEISVGDVDLSDLTFGLGVRFLFGAETPRDSWQNGRLLTAPRLPARSVDWLEALD
ncbi:hypothetical protein N0B44_09925 [Roseibacterium beibuensis]|uniref:Outer membrane protein beta-barrel domain-containing protein n=1 Tax=[Roseibacterium] beibuensis TaxID=1193142 RepID=A0ABP9LCH7_9RHOB|nr:hypothetical protein [Roseibacterium beibuensis]MCS6623229.1 hypothetical protein [Roseibacterium beibuensis]